MGLDISLYTLADAQQDAIHDEASNAFYERPDYNSLTEQERDRLRAEIPAYAPRVDVPSEKYPEHLFNRRYLRSSYNGAGFNRAVPDMLAGLDQDAVAEFASSEGDDVGSLYWIFQPMGREWDGDDGMLNKVDVPGLEAARDRAKWVADALAKCDPLRVMAIHMPIFGLQDHCWSTPPTEGEVLSWFRAEMADHAKHPSPFGGDHAYSNAKGTILGFKTGMDILAVTLGKDVLGQPSPMIVYRSEAVDSYIQSAEIVVEFCDEAIALIERDGGAQMSWSG